MIEFLGKSHAASGNARDEPGYVQLDRWTWAQARSGSGQQSSNACAMALLEILGVLTAVVVVSAVVLLQRRHKVVALGHYTATTPIGKKFDSDFAMVFTLRNGKVTEFQEFTDSAAVNAAYAVGVTA